VGTNPVVSLLHTHTLGWASIPAGFLVKSLMLAEISRDFNSSRFDRCFQDRRMTQPLRCKGA